jgi:AcrR family transcriptional regulator
MTEDPSAGAGAGLPPGVQLLWGLREAGRRGPKPSLTLDEIVSAAMEVADAEGLAAVSMARLAKQVGSSTMALYRYVANKDELLLLMSDAGIDDPPVLPAAARGPDGWRDGLEVWANAVRRIWAARPWLLQIPVNGPPAGPRNLAWLEAGLTGLAGTGLTSGERMDVVLTLSTYLRGEAMLTTDLRLAATTDPESHDLDYGGPLARLIDPERFPELAAIVSEGPFGAPNPDDDDEVEVGLQVVLDGIGHRIAARRRSSVG